MQSRHGHPLAVSLHRLTGAPVMLCSVATPVDWEPGQQCMVQPTLPDAAANQQLGGFSLLPVPSGRQYMRLTVRNLKPGTTTFCYAW